MKLKVALVVAAIYMTLVGIGHLISPIAMSAGVISADASLGLVAFVRHYAALFIAIAVLDWMARDVEASKARDAIVVANLVAFASAAVLDIVAVVSGAGLSGLVPAGINLAIAIMFVVASRAGENSGKASLKSG